jgi:hypothetical protein
MYSEMIRDVWAASVELGRDSLWSKSLHLKGGALSRILIFRALPARLCWSDGSQLGYTFRILSLVYYDTQYRLARLRTSAPFKVKVSRRKSMHYVHKIENQRKTLEGADQYERRCLP